MDLLKVKVEVIEEPCVEDVVKFSDHSVFIKKEEPVHQFCSEEIYVKNELYDDYDETIKDVVKTTESEVDKCNFHVANNCTTENSEVTVGVDLPSLQELPLPTVIKSSTGAKRYLCNICNYKSSVKRHVNLHMRIHAGEKPFKCFICDFKTAIKGNLNKHMLSHNDEKPFKCYICTFKSTQKGNLARHMRVHTSEKPFECNICNFKSAEKGNLIRHVRVHTHEKPFKCNLCNFKSADKGNLARHKRIHAREKLVKCNICHFKSIQKDDLVKHECNGSTSKQKK